MPAILYLKLTRAYAKINNTILNTNNTSNILNLFVLITQLFLVDLEE